jgi:hypothetical protein
MRETLLTYPTPLPNLSHCNVPFPLGSQNTVVVYPISRKSLDERAREMILVKSLSNYKVKLRKSEFINIKPLFEGISLQLLIK